MSTSLAGTSRWRANIKLDLTKSIPTKCANFANSYHSLVYEWAYVSLVFDRCDMSEQSQNLSRSYVSS